jgi:hypothetical protein
MRVADVATMRFVNYGFAVVAVPLGLSSAMHTPVMETSPARVIARSSALTDTAQKVENDWLELRRMVGDLLQRSAVQNTLDAVGWFETPADTLYPVPRSVEVLDVSIVENSSSDTFRFTDTDFDVWVD